MYVTDCCVTLFKSGPVIKLIPPGAGLPVYCGVHVCEKVVTVVSILWPIVFLLSLDVCFRGFYYFH